MLTEYDFAITGGGPAGSAAAMCLARLGWRVAIFEATALEENHPGETLPPEINPILRELGLWQSFQAQEPVESPGIISAWVGLDPQETDFACNPYGPGWHIDRRRFDRMLFDAAEQEGASVFLSERVEIARQGIGSLIKRPDRPALFARFAIDASGRNGMRIDGSRDRIVDDLLLVTIVQISFCDLRRRDLRTLVEATPSGWWYSACLPGNRLIAMFFTGRESYRRGDAFIQEQLFEAPLTCGRIHQPGNTQTRTTVVPVTSSRRLRITGEGWLSVGDSACSFDPLSGRGIFKALRHGAAAAKAASAAMRGEATALDRYAEMVRQEFDTYILQKELFYASQLRWPNRSFWKARAGPVKGVVDSVKGR
ncbi:MAG: tryptophan 7-halogenase [Acidobacteriota bacterium]|nr:tryptophan 7-halogenase [Acidobacteriota bacterium]